MTWLFNNRILSSKLHIFAYLFPDFFQACPFYKGHRMSAEGFMSLRLEPAIFGVLINDPRVVSPLSVCVSFPTFFGWPHKKILGKTVAWLCPFLPVYVRTLLAMACIFEGLQFFSVKIIYGLQKVPIYHTRSKLKTHKQTRLWIFLLLKPLSTAKSGLWV